MEKRSLLQVGVELYKCLMLTVVALLLLLILSEYRARTPGMQWTQSNPMPVKVVDEVEVSGEVKVTNLPFYKGLWRDPGTNPLEVRVQNWH